jgi:hypothetical protein
MQVRLNRVFYMVTAWVGLTAGVALSASVVEVSPPLMEAAECMATVLRAAPGVRTVEINVSAEGGAAYPVLAYDYLDRFGGRRFTEVRLFEISGAQAPFVFDWADVEGDPVAQRVLAP